MGHASFVTIVTVSESTTIKNILKSRSFRRVVPTDGVSQQTCDPI